MELLGWLVGLLLVWVVLQHLGLWLTWFNLCLQTVQQVQSRLIPQEDIAREDWDFYQPTITQLEALGFEYRCCLATRSMLAASPTANTEVLLTHPSTNTLAVISALLAPGFTQPISVLFINYFADNRAIHTVDCLKHMMLPYPSNTQLQDECFGDVHKQWQFHQDSLAQRAPQPPAPEALALAKIPDLALAQMSNEFYQALFGNLINQKILLQPFHSLTIFHPRHAFKYAQQIIGGLKQLSTQAQHPQHLSEEQAEYVLQKQLQHSNPMGSFGKLFGLMITGVLFYLSFGLAFSWALVPAILLVLIIHELGHYLAMRLFNYHNPAIYFVPFIGAVTVGKKQNATLWQELVVYLAGPLPGIALAFIIIYSPLALMNPWLITLAHMSLVINLVNLLPIFPLDGGKIVERLYFSRFPSAKLLFSSVSALLFLGAAWHLHSYFLGFFGVLMCASLSAQWQTLKHIKQYTMANQAKGELSPLRWLIQAESNIHKRLQFARSLQDFFNIPKADKYSALLGSFLYFTLLASSAFGAYYTLFSGYNDDDYFNADWADIIDQANTPEAKLSALIQAAAITQYDEDNSASQTYYAQAKTIANTLSPPNVQLAKLRLLKAELDKIPLTHSDIVFVEFNVFDDKSSQASEKVQAIMDLTSTKALLNDSDKLKLLLRAQDIASADTAGTFLSPSLLHAIGSQYQELRNPSEAEAYYLKGFSEELSQDYGVFFFDNFAALTELYFEDRRYVDAIELADQRLNFLDNYATGYGDEEEVIYYQNHTQMQKIPVLQIRAWFSLLNGWSKDAIEDTELAITIAEQTSENKRDYNLQYMTLLFDSIVFARAEKQNSIEEEKRVLNQPKSHLKRFAKHCDCKVRKGLESYRYQHYVDLIKELGISAE